MYKKMEELKYDELLVPIWCLTKNGHILTLTEWPKQGLAGPPPGICATVLWRLSCFLCRAGGRGLNLLDSAKSILQSLQFYNLQ